MGHADAPARRLVEHRRHLSPLTWSACSSSPTVAAAGTDRAPHGAGHASRPAWTVVAFTTTHPLYPGASEVGAGPVIRNYASMLSNLLLLIKVHEVTAAAGGGKWRLSRQQQKGDPVRSSGGSRVCASAFVVAALVFGLRAFPASAGTGTFINNGQGVSAGNAKSAAHVHKGLLVVWGDSNHTWCPAVAQGYQGYTSTPFTGGHSTAYQPAFCGPHEQSWYPNATENISLRGAAYNPNVSTFDTFEFAAWMWTG